jgi:hypothetical protein
LDSDKEVIEIAFDRRQLESLKSAVADTQDLYARCKVTMQESQELLQQVDDLLRTKASMSSQIRRTARAVVIPVLTHMTRRP